MPTKIQLSSFLRLGDTGGHFEPPNPWHLKLQKQRW